MRGAALGAAGATRAGVHADQPERLQLGGDGPGGGTGDAELGRQDGAGRGPARVDELQRRAEGAAAPLQLGPLPHPRWGPVAVHDRDPRMIGGVRGAAGQSGGVPSPPIRRVMFSRPVSPSQGGPVPGRTFGTP